MTIDVPGREVRVADRLRHKLSPSGEAKLVVNVWGVGYRLCDQALLA